MKKAGLSWPVQIPTPPRMLKPQPGDHLSHPWLREERRPGPPCPSPSAKHPGRNSRRHVSRHCTAIRRPELLPPELLHHTQGHLVSSQDHSTICSSSPLSGRAFQDLHPSPSIPPPPGPGPALAPAGRRIGSRSDLSRAGRPSKVCPRRARRRRVPENTSALQPGRSWQRLCCLGAWGLGRQGFWHLFLAVTRGEC